MGTSALVTNIQRYSLHDGGGIRTVAFLKGCPFRCPWCSNPENLSFEPQESLREALCIHCSRDLGQPCPRTPDECPTGAKELLGVKRKAGDLARECMRDRVFFEESGGGVTLSGGECLAPVDRQPFVRDFFTAVRTQGISTAIETTLAVPLVDPSGLHEVVDTWLVDFKISERTLSRRVTGIDPSLRNDNLKRLLALGAHVVGRMPIIPGFTDGRDNVLANIATMVGLGIDHADVLPFHQLSEGKYDSVGLDYACAGMRQLSAEDIGWVAELCERAGIHAVISGE